MNDKKELYWNNYGEFVKKKKKKKNKKSSR